MRGLLIVNPRATTTTENVTDLVARSLSGLVDLEVEHTRYRGHARELAAAARADVVIVLGGDGAVNEAVNGLMNMNGSRRPLIAVIPGGGANVFARGLGMPAGTAAAVRRVEDIIAAGGYRTIGLGLAGDRYFTFSAGLGMDAEVVREVDRQRGNGRRESTPLYLRTIARWYWGADRRSPALVLECDGRPPATGLFFTMITNRSPYTYLRDRALLPVPNPDFNSGLDLLALRRMRLGTLFSAASQMLWVRSRPPQGRHLLSVRGADSLNLRSARPIGFQVDGEYLGQVEAVRFQFVPHALRVIA